MRSFFRSASIKRKILMISLLSTSTAFFLISIILFAYELITFRHSLVHSLSIQAEIVGNNSASALLFNDAKTAEDILAAMSASKNIISAVIFKNDDRVFAKYLRKGEDESIPLCPIPYEGHHFGADHLALLQPIHFDGEDIGRIYIRSDLSQFYSRIAWYGITVILAMCSSFFVAFLIVSRLQYPITHPIGELVKITQTISQEKKYSIRTPVRNPDELGSLAESFNAMLVEIQKRDMELEQHRTHLREEVAQRTSELAEANERLKQELIERKKAEEDKKNLEEQLRQSQKMEAIGRLAGGVAHDFNNLLTVIKGYCQLSLLELSEENGLKKNIQEIQNAGDRAANLTRQLLAFSRKQMLEMKNLNLNTILRNLEKMLHRLIPENIQLSMQLAENLGQIRTDAGQIEQVIINLVVNAKDAMPEGGKLILGTSNVLLDDSFTKAHKVMKPGPYVMFSISDTGVGMTSEVRERIFEPFFTTKPPGNGTGLGLSTVYGIVKQSEGYVWPYSEPGQGTTFKLYFPKIEREIIQRKPSDHTVGLASGNETILLVEDELSVRDLTSRILRKHGYKVIEATNGEEGLHRAQEFAGQEIHLLLTDVVMPKMGGKDLAERIKLLRPKVKVLFTSGYTDNGIVQDGKLLPGVAFLEKPFSATKLAWKVRNVLDK